MTEFEEEDEEEEEEELSSIEMFVVFLNVLKKEMLRSKYIILPSCCHCFSIERGIVATMTFPSAARCRSSFGVIVNNKSGVLVE